MSETVIKVDNLSKSYLISHKSNERYVALRDVMARGVKNFTRKLLSPFTIHHSLSSQSPFTIHDSPFTNTSEEFFALKDVSFKVQQGDRDGKEINGRCPHCYINKRFAPISLRCLVASGIWKPGIRDILIYIIVLHMLIISG